MNWKVILIVAGMLLTGAINTLTKKGQLNTKSEDITGQKTFFNPPWFQTWSMFIGESLCLIGFLFQRWRQNKKREELHNQTSYPILISEEDTQPSIFQPILILPTICDLAGSTLAGVGLLWTDASVWQMLRGSLIIFTGIMSIIFLKRKLKPFNWIGMAIVAVGLALVGVTSILNKPSSSDWKMYLGIGLILLGQLCSAAQMVVEETYLKGRRFPALQVVGTEGVFGFLIMSFVFLPVIYFIPGDQPSHFSHGSYENTLNSFVQISHSTLLIILNVGYICSIAFFNYFGLSVTKYLTSVHRTLIDACRTVIVWTVSLFIFYVIDEAYGEPWTKYSPIQVVGFGLLVIGTLVYNSILKIPFLSYETPESKATPEFSPLLKESNNAEDR